MPEKNLLQRFIVIGVVLLGALVILFRFDDGALRTNLRPGLDIAGGVSMIFEIDETGLEQATSTNIAEEMKLLLQERVDPQGVFGLEWRVHGRNRIEVQMPLPPPDIEQYETAYLEAQAALYATRIREPELETILALPADERSARFEEVARGSDERAAALADAADAYDAWQAARAERAAAEDAAASATQPATEVDVDALDNAVRDAEEDLLDATDAVLELNFPATAFEAALERKLSTNPEAGKRYTELKERWLDVYPSLAEQITAVVETYNAWSSRTTGLDGPDDLRRLMRGSGVLSFRLLAEPLPDNQTRYDQLREDLEERGPRAASAREPGFEWFKVDDPVAFFNLRSAADLEGRDIRDLEGDTFILGQYQGDYYVLARTDPEGALVGDTDRSWQLTGAYADRDNLGRPSVAFSLDVVGARRFARLTGDNIGAQLGIFLDEVAYSAARIQSQISGQGTITGDFNQQKIAYLIKTMKAGALPAALKDTPISERTLGSSLGAENLSQALRAGIVGFAIVAVVMILYYWSVGLVANAALMLNIVLVLSAMAMLEARVSLAGIAGIILTIGMAVDANVLIFERMREERARGSSLRMIIKNGYDKALSTIVDANVTTLLTSIIIYFVGSEEIKGFGLTLGWGIVLSLFTSLFVTRTIFALLLKYDLIKDIKAVNLVGVPKIDWYAKRKIFLPISLGFIAIGGGLLFARGADALDVEFRGGVNAEFVLREPTVTIDGETREAGDIAMREAVGRAARIVREDAAKLANAEVSADASNPRRFIVSTPGIPAAEVEAMIAEPLEDAGYLARGGVDVGEGEERIAIRTRETVSVDTLRDVVRGLSGYVADAAAKIEAARVVEIIEADRPRGSAWNITTIATNKSLVQHVLERAMGDNLDRRPRIDYVVRTLPGGSPYPVSGRRLGAVIPEIGSDAAGRDVAQFREGAALYFADLQPALSVEAMTQRIKDMRLQPDFRELPWRDFDVIGASATGATDPRGYPTFTEMVVLVADDNLQYSESSPEQWRDEFAEPELRLVEAALSTEQSLRKVSQFKPQIAAQSQTRATIALLLSWGVIIGYMWLRFGKPAYGVAGVVALIHDVFIALAAVGISGWIGGIEHPIGQALLIDDFHINMVIVAAFLTIIGYSINDTIVVFDRVRETRGRLGVVTPQIVNLAINQTLARTIMTSFTTLLVLGTMYIFGGSTIRGFNYCMIIGILTGTYSSIAVAAPLLVLSMRRQAARLGADAASI